LITKYQKAIGVGTNLSEDDLKALWKDHFARQITVNELTVMKTFRESHLTTADVAKVATLSDGKFDDTVLYRLLSSLSTSFELYSPDNTAMIYLKQHSQALRWEHKFDFRPPKEKERDKSDHKGKDSSSTKESQPRKRKSKSDHKSFKAKGIKMTDKSSPNPKRIKSSDQCKRRDCRRRGTHTNHTHDECKFKESESAKHPNVGKA
jgi:hypothetical protein